jgi:hypothetical protein
MEYCTTFWQVSICSTGFPANVTYQELDVPLSHLPPQLRCFLPNVWYSGSSEHDHLRLVALVSTTDIEEGDEVFSTYYTVIRWSFLIIPFPFGSLTEAVKLEQIVCLWLLTADSYIQSQGRSYGSCVGRVAIGWVFSEFFPCHFSCHRCSKFIFT